MRFFSVLNLAWVAFLLVPFAFADDPAAPLPTGDFLMQLWTLVGGMRGASALGIAVAVTQMAMLFFRTELAKFAGKWKLAIVFGLNVVVAVLGALASGTPILGAVLNGATIAAIQVFANEVIKHAKEDPAG